MKLVDGNGNSREMGKAISAGFYLSMFIYFEYVKLVLNLSVASSLEDVKESGLLKFNQRPVIQ